MISLICPSRGRPQKSFETISSWISCAGNVELEVLIAVEHEEFLAYIEPYSKLPLQIAFFPGEYGSAVKAINEMAKHAKGNIMIVVSDDTACCSAWGNRILKYTEGKRDFVMKVRDGIQPQIITMPILDRAYYQRDGWIYHPRFSHAWSDRMFTDLAHKRKRVITKNIMFRHNHYSISKGKKRDAQYERTDATFNEGRQIYKELKKEYGL
jgi:hypothetical protein